jgi:hypothetical protein
MYAPPSSTVEIIAALRRAKPSVARMFHAAHGIVVRISRIMTK